MGSKQFLPLFLFFLVVGLASSSSPPYISNEALQPRGSFGRSLLQQKIPCSVDFEKMNFTMVTSQCKGPHYTADRCCAPLKDLICPIRDDFNDMRTTCPDSFFSYLNLFGKYPPGLFAALCRETQSGLDCQSTVQQSKSHASPRSPLCLMLSGGLAFLMALVLL